MTFPTEAERQRAREACAWATCQCPALHCIDRVAAETRFDLLYPAQPDAPPSETEKPDFYYETDNWEYTWRESDFYDALSDYDYDKRVVRVGRLKELPDQWAARVPVGEPDEEGDYEDYEWTLFATEAEARTAAKEKHDD